MATRTWKKALGTAIVMVGVLCAAKAARADDATVTVGTVGHRYADPPNDPQVIVADDHFIAQAPELKRSPLRLALGPVGVTTGKGFGLGVGLAADFGSGSVGGRLAAAWARGEGTVDGKVTATGDSIGQYTAEITLDPLKRGPVHPIIGMGAGVLHVSRPDASGYAGVGTGRLALEYALGLEDADVRLGASVTGGLVGPVDDDVKDLRAYALVGAHLAIGF